SLMPLRERESVTGAILQRYTILAEQLAEEARRMGQRRVELQDRLRQIAADGSRERDLVAESEQSLAAYEEEQAQLETEQEYAQAEFDRIQAEAEAARSAVGDAERKARETASALAEFRARRAQAERSVNDAANRRLRLGQQLDEVQTDLARVTAALDADETLSLKRAELETAQAAALEAEAVALSAEEAANEAQDKLDTARPRLAELEALVTRLEAEASTLAKMLNTGSSLWPAVMDE